VTITFQNGEILKGIGKLKSSVVKFKKDEKAEAQEFEFSKLKSVEFEYAVEKNAIYKFFKVKDSENYIPVEELVSGNKAELFKTSATYYTGGIGMGVGGMNGMGGMGGMGMGMGVPMGTSQTVTYYVKKPNEDILTELGAYNILTNNLKGKVKDYFADCKVLIEKLENREFKVRKGLKDIVNFYNNNCE
jgi:hypothetical protein